MSITFIQCNNKTHAAKFLENPNIINDYIEKGESCQIVVIIIIVRRKTARQAIMTAEFLHHLTRRVNIQSEQGVDQPSWKKTR